MHRDRTRRLTIAADGVSPDANILKLKAVLASMQPRPVHTHVFFQRGRIDRSGFATWRARLVVSMTCLMVVYAASTQAQSTSPDAPRNEDIEPLQIGTTGTTMIGVAGYVDEVFDPDRAMPLNYTAEFEVGRFLTPRIVVHGGMRGAGSVGGEMPDERPTGNGALALHATGGARFYFTPQAIASVYTGGEYWTQLTQRTDGDVGTLVGTLGLQGAVSSRASLFVEGGYGIGLTRDDGELSRRLVGRLGVRLKF